MQQIHAHDEQVQGEIDSQETRTLTCLTKKCAREVLHNFNDEAIAKYCDTYKLEGMLHVGTKQRVQVEKGERE